MSSYKGNTQIVGLYKGNTEIIKRYKGSSLFYEAFSWEDYGYNYLYNSLVPTTIDSKSVKDKARIKNIYANGVIENQLVDTLDTSITLGTHKYLTYISGTWSLITGTNQTLSVNGGVDMVIDLTQMFGTGNEPTVLTDNRIQKILNSGYIEFNAGTYKGTDISEFSSALLPDIYQEVEYIESTGTQYIDSGIIGKGGLYTKSKIMQTANGTGTLLACRNILEGRVYLGYRQYNNTINLGYKLEISSLMNMSLNTLYECEYDTRNSKGIVKINGTEIINQTIETSFSTGTNLFIFANNSTYNNQIIYSSNLRCYYLQIYDNDTLVRNFIPCYRKSDNVIGLFDTVNQVFYTNQGTGTFSKGADVNGYQLFFIYQGNGALNSHDILEITNSEYVFTKNVNSVDLGTLTYGYQSDDQRFRSWEEVSNAVSTSRPANLLCPKYKVQTSLNLLADKEIYLINKYVYIQDHSYTDATTFKSAIAGVPLYYELATPQVIRIPRKHLGIVDLGSLSWSYSGGSFSANLNHYHGGVGQYSNLYCAKYIERRAGGSYDIDNAIFSANTSYIRIRDDSFNGDTTAFKNSLSNQYLFYETEDEVADIPFTLDIEAGGTITSDSDVLPNVDFDIKCK